MSTIITNIDQLDLVNGIYTYADYLMWKIKDRVEILKGKIFKMSPAPAISHQSISFNLSGLFFMYFHNKPCKVFASPFDVVFKNKDGKFICNAHIAKGHDSNGTYRARKFYVKNVYSLDDYNLVNHLYNIAYPEFQRLIDDEAEDGFFRKSINYFKEKGMDKTVKALQDIHNKRKI